jgi:glycerol-3-phosphate O-acyltransferase
MSLSTETPQKSSDIPEAESSSEVARPQVEFKQIPIAQGPLSRFNRVRPRVVKDVVDLTYREFAGLNLDSILGEALYQERSRIRRFRPNLFTRKRHINDIRLWNRVQSQLVLPPALADRKPVLKDVLDHYAEEIAGNFNESAYWFATRFVPWSFRWLLNAAAAERFLPWGMTESLESRVHILGDVPRLRKLSEQGTILLVPTHQSNIDSVLIGYLIYLMGLPPFAYGAGLNLFSNPVLSFFMRRLGAYTVDRQKSNTLYKHALKNYSTRILREGIHSIFFPGGGRARSGAIESKLKLGLLGTGLEAMIYNLKDGKPRPNVFVVPMTTSYDFVLEAGSLIEDYLAESGKHRYLMTGDESWQYRKVLNFFWRMFSNQSGITVRVGRPMDVLGNFVDEEGRSIGPNGTTIDPAKWFMNRGVLVHDEQRDREYTKELGERIVERFHAENTVLASHAVAFTLFETLRRQYADLDLFRFLRITKPQRTLPMETFLQSAQRMHERLCQAADQGRLYLADELKTGDVRAWVEKGVKHLGVFHSAAVVKVEDGTILSEDMQLLYYYRNRLTGYGFEG